MTNRRQHRQPSPDETRRRWVEYAREHLEGRTIVAVDYLTSAAAERLDWYECPVVLTLDNGTQLMPWRDDEGNGAGALGGETPGGELLLCPVLRRF
jgi:hypothetical protein